MPARTAFANMSRKYRTCPGCLIAHGCAIIGVTAVIFTRANTRANGAIICALWFSVCGLRFPGNTSCQRADHSSTVIVEGNSPRPARISAASAARRVGYVPSQICFPQTVVRAHQEPGDRS